MVSFFSKAWFLCDRPDLPTGTIGTIIWKPGLIQTNFGLYSNTLRTARPETTSAARRLLFTVTTAIKKYCARALQELLHIARYNRCLLQFNFLVTFPRKKGVVVLFLFILKEQATGKLRLFVFITMLLRTNMEIKRLVFLLSIEHPSDS